MASGDLNFRISKTRGAPINQLLAVLGPRLPNLVYVHHCQVGREQGLGGVKGATSLRAQVGNLHVEMYGHNLPEI